MGLFGYNEKDYKTNAAEMTNLIQEMMGKVTKYEGVGKVLNKAFLALAEPYPRDAKSKELAAIDERIFDLLSKMNTDLQKKSFGMLSAHANMILTAICDSRAYGKENSTPQELKAEETIATYNALIRDNLIKKAEIKAQMAEIEEQFNELAEDDPECEELERQYEECQNNLFTLDDRYREYREEYNAATAHLNLINDNKFYDDLPEELSSPQEFDRMIADVSKKREARAGRRQEKDKSYQDYIASKQRDNANARPTGSTLRDKANARKQAELDKSIGNATVTGNTADSGAPTLRRLSRD